MRPEFARAGRNSTPLAIRPFGGSILHRVFAGVFTVGLLLIGTPAYAAPPVTETFHEKNVVETFVDVVPTCEGGGPPYEITTTSNRVFQITEFDDGRVYMTFTDTGTFVAEPLEDPSLPSYTGKFTVWGGFNANNQTVKGTFTFSARGTGSDGSTFKNHVTDHFNVTPNGTEFFFTHCHD